MKQVFLVFSLLVLIAAFSSCKKDNKPLNIDYPAAFVVNGESNNLSVINLTTDKVTETIDLNGATFPHHVYLNPDKTRIAVAITSTDLSGGHGGHGGSSKTYKVLVIDSKTGEIHHTLELPKLPHNAIFSPDGSELWVGQADATQSKVLVFNTSNFSEKASIVVGKGLSEVTFSADGMKVFAANTDDNTVSIINPANKSVLSTIPVGNSPVGAWAGSNGKMYADNEASQTISEIDAVTSTITATINLGFKPGYVAYSDHHSELWVSDATNGKVIYYKLESGIWVKKGEIPTGSDAHAIAFTSDGKTAYVTNQGANTVSVVEMNSHMKMQDITAGKKPNGLVIKE